MPIAAPTRVNLSAVHSGVNSGHHRGHNIGVHCGICKSFASKDLKLTGKLTELFFMDTEAIAKQIDMLASGLAVLKRMVEQESPVFPSNAQALVDKGLCLNCGKPLGKGRPVRGNHEKCYRQTKRAIDAQVLTEFEAVEKGLFQPKDPGGSRRNEKSQLAKVLAEKDEILAEANQRVAKKLKQE